MLLFLKVGILIWVIVWAIVWVGIRVDIWGVVRKESNFPYSVPLLVTHASTGSSLTAKFGETLQ